MTPFPEFAVIGPGRLGTALATSLRAAGARCGRVRARDAATAVRASGHLEGLRVDHWDAPAGALPGLVVVCVPDPEIGPVAHRLAPDLVPSSVVLHTSGRLTSDELAPCRRAGAAVASWHPLQTFTGGTVPPSHWHGVPCAVEGDPRAVTCAETLSMVLGAAAWTIRPDVKPRYHAAAAVASNLTHLLVAGAREVMLECGLPEAVGLWPLVRDSTRAALEHPDLAGLSGALARGDDAAVKRHLESLPPTLREVYRVLAAALRRDDATDWLD
jgi:predicted short-subunit dehydrogenase-like oxidoreductase (DUF2520 family)